MKKNIIPHNNSSIQVRRIENTAEFENLRADWTILLLQNCTQDAFLSWEWSYAWWQCYGKEKELWLVTAWDQNKLIGIAPLVLIKKQKYGIESRFLCSLGVDSLDVGGFIIQNGDPGIYSAICNFLINNNQFWDILKLNEFGNDDPGTMVLIDIFQKLGWLVRKQDKHHYFLPIQSTWLDYWKQLSRNLRKDLNKKKHHIEEMGKVTYIHHRGSEVTSQDLDTIFKINAHGRYVALYQSDEERNFQAELNHLMSQKGWFDVHFLYIDHNPVAYNSGFCFQNKFEGWRTGFNTDYFQFSVGKILMMLVIEDCFNRCYREMDFLRGEEDYKYQWKIEERVFCHLFFIPPKKPIQAIIFFHLPKIKKMVKKFLTVDTE